MAAAAPPGDEAPAAYHPLSTTPGTTLDDIEPSGSTLELYYATLINEDKRYFSLPSDTWGVALFAVINDLPDIVVREASLAQIVRFAFAMTVLFTNIIMQVLILHWVGFYVVGESVREMQLHYQQYHARSFDTDGAFNREKWERDVPLRSELCDAAMSQFLFLFFISFLWAARILVEIRSIFQLNERIILLHTLPPGAPNAHMVCERERGGEKRYDIVALSRGARISLYVLVLIPKLCIAFFLLYIGVKWLASTANFKNLILNALGLEFVLHIDELFFTSFFPEEEHDTVVAAHWAVPKEKQANGEPLTAQQVNRQTMILYCRCGAWIMFTLGFVYIYLTEFQNVLPGYKFDINHCNGFIEEYLTPLCPAGSLGLTCFPFGS